MEKRKSELTREEKKSLLRQISIRFFLVPVFLGLLILWPAGTFHYWQFYLYITVLFFPMMLVLMYFLKNDPKFLQRRMKTTEKEKQQKIIQLSFSFSFFLGYILCGLDHRYGWSDIPAAMVIAADAIILLGYLMVFFVFKQNSYASRVVEVEQSQSVISTGLYAYVRHPMYVGVICMFVTTPIALGSYWGLICMGTIPLALVLRILNEEKVLCRELPGYAEYCQKTKYRLIPHVW